MQSNLKPRPGSWVVTADGQDLGHVSEVADRCFKVSAPVQGDDWLDHEYVADCTDQGVSLNVSKESSSTSSNPHPRPNRRLLNAHPAPWVAAARLHLPHLDHISRTVTGSFVPNGNSRR